MELSNAARAPPALRPHREAAALAVQVPRRREAAGKSAGESRGGTGLVQLTDGSGFDLSPVWSYDGRKIAFFSDRTGTAQIVVVEADGSDETQLTSLRAGADSPDWSPDGRKIAFISDFQIFTMDRDGSDLAQLTAGPDMDFFPAWSPDGKKLAFIRESRENQRRKLMVMNSDGSNPRESEAPRTICL